MATMQRYDGIVQTTTGVVIPGASVQVNVKSSGAAATIYSDEGATGKTNPLTSGSDGSFFFYAADDDYTIAATYGGNTYTLGDVTLHSPPGWRQFVTKAASVPVNASTTLKDDEELLFTVLDNETWEYSLGLSITTTAAADLKFAFNTTPGGSGSGRHISHSYETASTFAYADFQTFGSLVTNLYGGAVTAQPLMIHGFFIATADCTVNFTWAQNTSDATNTHVNTGSWLIARKVLLA